MSKILRLQSTNYKKLVATEITPEGNLVVINGKNGAGKSSILDSITAALGGVSKRDTPKPIREGQDSAEIVLETEELVVTRRFTQSGSTLVVTNHEGAKFPKGQAKLDDLLGKLSLDPFAFTQLSEKAQLEQLLALVDLPFDPKELEQQRKDLYDQRAEVGRQGKAIGEVEVDESLPADEQSAGELIKRIQDVQNAQRDRDEFDRGIQLAEEKVKSITDQIAQLKAELADWESRLKARLKERDSLPAVEDTAAIEEQLANVEESNAAIRANNDARRRKAEQDRLRDKYEKFTDSLKELDKTKADGLAKAEMPVEGLGFDSDGVTYEGIPFKQTNTASQIRVSFAMAMAMNPKLRVIRIAEGSLLDEDNLKLVADMAEENDFQVWIESVGQGDGTGIIIEDGEVVNE